ncbi:MAG TPA: hypothetical protein VI603_03250 [Saprospiraceae bacterium]|nr:hypothetical protein [Saprospiraceae bacterium]
MRKFQFGVLAAVCSLALFTSCNKEDGTSSALTLSDDQSVDLRGRNPSVSGHVELDSLGEGRFQKYSFTAVQHKDGSVKGEFQLFDFLDDSTTVVIHGDVECFTIQDDGKTAWLGGVVERGMLDSTNFAGAEAYWTVVDNGQGANAEPDEATEIVYEFDGLLAQDHCADGLGTFVYFGPILRSNVKVKP